MCVIFPGMMTVTHAPPFFRSFFFAFINFFYYLAPFEHNNNAYHRPVINQQSLSPYHFRTPALNRDDCEFGNRNSASRSLNFRLRHHSQNIIVEGESRREITRRQNILETRMCWADNHMIFFFLIFYSFVADLTR